MSGNLICHLFIVALVTAGTCWHVSEEILEGKVAGNNSSL